MLLRSEMVDEAEIPQAACTYMIMREPSNIVLNTLPVTSSYYPSTVCSSINNMRRETAYVVQLQVEACGLTFQPLA